MPRRSAKWQIPGRGVVSPDGFQWATRAQAACRAAFCSSVNCSHLDFLLGCSAVGVGWRVGNSVDDSGVSGEVDRLDSAVSEEGSLLPP